MNFRTGSKVVVKPNTVAEGRWADEIKMVLDSEQEVFTVSVKKEEYAMIDLGMGIENPIVPVAILEWAA